MDAQGLLLAGTILGLCMWASVLVVPWRAWSTRERLDAAPQDATPAHLPDVTVLIPARNEAATLGETLASLVRQGIGFTTVVVDDQSADETLAVARRSALAHLQVVEGKPLAPGWRGKVWALQQGLARVHTPYVLLLDADIELRPGMLNALYRHLTVNGYALCSVMVQLDMQGFWGRVLNPAFVFFFKLLYPFALSNRPGHWVAASAGGAVLVRSETLRAIGGFGAIKDALIDDCSLARAIKRTGARTWIGLTRSACSHRANEDLASLWHTVVRSAFAQLRHSAALLLLCTLAMGAVFVAPPTALIVGPPTVKTLGGIALIAMALSYWPVLKFYELSPLWALLMPVTGVLFLLMTWHSALRHWFGQGTTWKARVYRA